MKRILVLLLSVVMSVSLFSACQKEQPEEKETENYGLVIYVDVDGNDQNDGTKTSPLATINGAVNMVSQIKASSGIPEGGIKIEFAEGRYRLSEKIDFTAENGGEEDKPIAFVAAKDAEVIIDGGVKLNGADFKPVTDETFLSLLPTEEARNNVLCIDLNNYSVEKFSTDSNNFDLHYIKQQLSANGSVQTIARWPNGDEFAWSEISDNEGENSYFKITEEQAIKWSKSPTFGWFGYGAYDWQCSFLHDAVAIDTESNVFVIPNNRVHYAPCADDMPYYIYNTPCELDEPGEYYRDMDKNILYYWPIADINTLDLSIGSLSTEAFFFDGGKNIKFDGLDFQNFPKGIFRGENLDGLYIYNSVISSCYEFAIDIGGYNITIDHCEMYDIAAGGIYIRSGDWTKQECGNVYITNNKLHDTSTFEINHHAALKIGGWGVYVAHNLFYDVPHHAIEDLWPIGNSIIEYNEFYHCSYYTVDSAAIHIGRSWVNRDFIVRYNYFHDIYCDLFSGDPAAVYFDDTSSGDVCYSNIIVNVAGNGINLCGGRDLLAYNNVLVNIGGNGIYMDGRGFGFAKDHLSYINSSSMGTIWNYFYNYYQSDIWRYCLPEILLAHESNCSQGHDEPHGLDCAGTPAYGRVYNNIGYNLNMESELRTRDYYPENYDFEWFDLYTKDGVCAVCGWSYQFNSFENNILYTEDIESIFTDPENDDFFLKEDSRVYRDLIGFEAWDYSLIGIK